MSIFVSIASYCDPELEHTIANLMDMADSPHDIRISVFDQDEQQNTRIKFLPYVDYSFIDINESNLGTGYARRMASNKYNNEDYYFQIDSHMRFVRGWDTKLINDFNDAVKIAGTKKIVISHSPLSYNPINNTRVESDKTSTLVVVNDDQCFWTSRMIEAPSGTPHESQIIMAAFLFTTGRFIDEVPYDDKIMIKGEEITISIRAYTRGWKIYCPNEYVAWHYYDRPNSKKKWLDDNGEVTQSWKKQTDEEFDYVSNILCGVDLDIYGIDDIQLYEEYQQKIGISFHGYYDVIIPMKLGVAPSN